MTREDLGKVDQAQTLTTRPDREFDREALVPRLVRVTYSRPPMNS